MRKHFLLTLATMLTLIATAGILRALGGPPAERAGGPGPDADFIAGAAQAGIAGIRLSKLAQENGGADGVRTLAERLETDQRSADGSLRTLADRQQVRLETEPDAPHKSAHARLARLSGASFDRAWADQMVKDHEAAIAIFSTAASSAADAEVRAFAAARLPALRAHLKQSIALLKVSTGGSRAGR